MKFSIIAASAALFAGAMAHSNDTAPVYVTEVVTAYTTYCPAATELTHGGSTYTITQATTLTLPCPGGCTITKPVSSAVIASTPVPVVATSAPVVPVSKSTLSPVVSSVPVVAYSSAPFSNGTVTKATSGVASGTGVSTAAPSTFTGAANKAFAASGAGLAAVLGLAAYAL